MYIERNLFSEFSYHASSLTIKRFTWPYYVVYVYIFSHSYNYSSYNWICRCRKEDGTLRTMNAEKLLKTLPVLQSQLDALLEFDCTANDLTNGVINMAFMLLFRDLIRLFACYNDGIINLLGNAIQCSFSLSRNKCTFGNIDNDGIINCWTYRVWVCCELYSNRTDRLWPCRKILRYEQETMPRRFRSLQEVSYTYGQGRRIFKSCGSKLCTWLKHKDD